MAQNIFKLVLTDEAQNFIESLPEAVSYKIYYNIKRVAGGERNVTRNSSKSWKTRRYGSFVHCITKLLIACLLFGTRTKKHW